MLTALIKVAVSSQEETTTQRIEQVQVPSAKMLRELSATSREKCHHRLRCDFHVSLFPLRPSSHFIRYVGHSFHRDFCPKLSGHETGVFLSQTGKFIRQRMRFIKAGKCLCSGLTTGQVTEWLRELTGDIISLFDPNSHFKSCKHLKTVFSFHDDEGAVESKLKHSWINGDRACIPVRR